MESGKLKTGYWVFVLAVLYIFVIAIPKITFPDLDHGDAWSDAYALNAVGNFIKFGFVKLHFLPFVEANTVSSSSPYTHSPCLTTIVNGFLGAVFKTDTLTFFRGVSISISFLALLFWFLFVRKFTGSSAVAFLCSIFYLTNPLFIFSADSLEIPYAELFKNLSLLIFITMSFVNENRKRVFWLVLLYLLLVIQSLIDYDSIIYFALFAVLFNIFLKNEKRRLYIKEIIILLTAAVLGFLIHFLRNSWYFGGFSLAFDDLRKTAIGGMINRYDSCLPLTFSNWGKYVLARNFSLALLFDCSILSVGIICCYLLYRFLPGTLKQQIKNLFFLAALLTICGIGWYVLFPAHSLAHAFVLILARHLLPVAAMGFTIFTLVIFSHIREGSGINLWLRLFLIGIIVSIALIGIIKSQLPITRVRIERSLDFLKFKQCLLSLKEMSRQKDEIGVNYYRYPFINYYTQRHCRLVFDSASLEQSRELPEYFIFLPYADKDTRGLFRFLSERYARRFQCQSWRFPAIFFELRK